VTEKKNTRVEPRSKTKKAPAFHARRDALLAWMREDPRRALGYVAYAWLQRAKYFGHPEDAPMAEVLWALQDADARTLRAKNGPRAWARSTCEMPFPLSKAEAGRKLVAWIEGWVKTHGDVPTKDAHAREFAFWVGGIVDMIAPIGGWGQPFSRDPGVIDGRVVAELAKLRGRLQQVKADHLAVAVLVGWGMSRAKAKDAVKYA
jgi:hypothetical protein